MATLYKRIINKSFIFLYHDQKGNILPLFALMIVVLMSLIGAAIDFSNAWRVKSHVQKVLDLTALSAVQKHTQAFEDVSVFADKYLKANLGTTYLKFVDSTDISLDKINGANGPSLTMTSNLKIPTSFLYLMGIKNVSMTVSSKTDMVIKSTQIALAFDVSTSMKSGRATSAKEAAHWFLDELKAKVSQTSVPIKVSLIPWATSVNPGMQYENWLVNLDQTAYAPDVWGGCTLSRSAPYDISDAPPSVEKFTPLIWTSDYQTVHNNIYANDWPAIINSGESGTRGPNKTCNVNLISPLTSDLDKIADDVNNLDFNGTRDAGYTNPLVGFVWAWRTLSNKWDGYWDGTIEKDYKKIIVLLSDGETRLSLGRLTNYGFPGENGLSTEREGLIEHVNNRFLEACNNAKKQGMTIYTILFVDQSLEAVKPLKECASKEGNFSNPTNAESLKKAFEAIVNKTYRPKIIK